MTNRTRGLLAIVLLTASPAAFAEVEIVKDVIYGHVDSFSLVYDVLKPDYQNDAAVIRLQSGGIRSRMFKGPSVTAGLT